MVKEKRMLEVPMETSTSADKQVKVYSVGSNRMQVLCTHAKERLSPPKLNKRLGKR